jgi:hypothetical protein
MATLKKGLPRNTSSMDFPLQKIPLVAGFHSILAATGQI